MQNIGKFVIQKHEKQGQDVHWDLMLEVEGVLQTYRLDIPPENLAGQICRAVRIFDHPLKFLTYQGSVNKGLGTVEIAETGSYELISKTDTAVQLRLNGNILRGNFSRNHIQADTWEFTRQSAP